MIPVLLPSLLVLEKERKNKNEWPNLISLLALHCAYLGLGNVKLSEQSFVSD